MSIKVISTIKPVVDNVFPVVQNQNIQGGFKVVQNAAALDLIIANHRESHMLVFSIAENCFYQLQSDGITWVQNPDIFSSNNIFNFISPTITSDLINYTTSGFSTANAIRLSSTDGYNITGFDSTGLSVVNKKLYNVGTSTFTIKHRQTSNQANQIIIPGGNDFIFEPDDSLEIVYDNISQRWRLG